MMAKIHLSIEQLLKPIWRRLWRLETPKQSVHAEVAEYMQIHGARIRESERARNRGTFDKTRFSRLVRPRHSKGIK